MNLPHLFTLAPAWSPASLAAAFPDHDPALAADAAALVQRIAVVTAVETVRARLGEHLDVYGHPAVVTAVKALPLPHLALVKALLFGLDVPDVVGSTELHTRALVLALPLPLK